MARPFVTPKEQIENDVIYVEDWSSLNEVLYPLLNGDNNSLDSIKSMRNQVLAAEDTYNRTNFTDNAIFIGGLTAIGAPAIKAGISAVGSSVVSAPTVGQISFQTQDHIMQNKHAWDKVVSNPNSWNEICDIVMNVVKNGTESSYGSALQKTMQIKDQIVVVTYKIVDGVIRISDGWVQTK